MHVHYASGWNRHKRSAGDSINADEARSRATSGESFCVVLGDSPDRPSGFIEVGGTMHGVDFLDEQQRVYLSYTLDVIDDRVFLSQAFFFEFDLDQDKPTKSICYYFDRTGTVTIEQRSSASSATSVTSRPYDVTHNWEPAPTFDTIAELFVKERRLA